MKATDTQVLRRADRRQGRTPRASRARTDLALVRLRRRLLRSALAETDNPRLHLGLRRAAAEAESLAWLSPCPLLVLPALFEEKAREARLYAIRQADLREASREWFSLAE
jgi:hypothetical protein